RYGVAKSFLEALGKHEGTAAWAQVQLMKALAQTDPKARRSALEDASRDNFGAAIAYAFVCIMPAASDCAGEAVDVVLPWAEKSSALALLMLAVAYEHGRGVKRSESNARALVERAERRLGEDEGTLLFTSFSALAAKETGEISPIARKTLE